MISNFFVSPFGVFTIVILLLVALYVAIGATPGRRWAIPRRNREKTTPTPQPPQQPKPAAVVEPASPKPEPELAAPKVEPDQPCAQERREIERLKLDNESLKKPKELVETTLLTLMDDFRKINQTAASMLTSEARKADPDAIKAFDHLEKLRVFCETAGYEQKTHNELMKLLWSANKARRDNP